MDANSIFIYIGQQYGSNRDVYGEALTAYQSLSKISQLEVTTLCMLQPHDILEGAEYRESETRGQWLSRSWEEGVTN